MDFLSSNLPVLGTLHIAALDRDARGKVSSGVDSRMIIPTKRDYSKILEFLKAAWPSPWPEYHMWEDAFHVLNYFRWCKWVVVDTEYDPERNNRLYQVGLYSPGQPVIIWDRDRVGAAIFSSSCCPSC